MAEDQRAPEISEETRRLAAELGRRLSEGPARGRDADADRLSAALSPGFGRQDDPRREIVARLRDLADYLEHSPRAGSLRDLAPDIESRLAELGERLQLAMKEEAGRLYMRGREALRREYALANSVWSVAYLRPVLDAIEDRRSGAFWLQGEDARARGHAVEGLAALMRRSRPGGRGDWQVSRVDFALREASDALGARLLDAWRTWPEGQRLLELRRVGRGRLSSILSGPATAVLLSDLPTLRPQTAPFLAWLTGQLVDSSAAWLLLVSAERQPPAETASGFDVIEAKSDAVRSGERLRTLRLARRLTRPSLAKAAGVAAAAVTEIEVGLRLATPEEMARLAAALRVEPSELREERP